MGSPGHKGGQRLGKKRKLRRIEGKQWRSREIQKLTRPSNSLSLDKAQSHPARRGAPWFFVLCSQKAATTVAARKFNVCLFESQFPDPTKEGRPLRMPGSVKAAFSRLSTVSSTVGEAGEIGRRRGASGRARDGIRCCLPDGDWQSPLLPAREL